MAATCFSYRYCKLWPGFDKKKLRIACNNACRILYYSAQECSTTRPFSLPFPQTNFLNCWHHQWWWSLTTSPSWYSCAMLLLTAVFWLTTVRIAAQTKTYMATLHTVGEDMKRQRWMFQTFWWIYRWKVRWYSSSYVMPHPIFTVFHSQILYFVQKRPLLIKSRSSDI